MQGIFLTLLNLSIAAGWLVLAVIVLRLIFKKAPRWVFCVLWGIAALRLVLPFSIESALSLIPSAETVPTDIVSDDAPHISSGIYIIDDTINPALSGAAESTDTSVPAEKPEYTPAPEKPVQNVTEEEKPAAEPREKAAPVDTIVKVSSWVWLFGMAAMLIYSAVSLVVLKVQIGESLPLRDNIRTVSSITSPFVLGLIKPVIYIPRALEGADMEYVLSHERAHIKRGDHWWKALGFVLLAVYWFNPLMWAAYILFCRDVELACDEKVISDMDKESRRAYSAALLNCSVKGRRAAVYPLAFGEVGVKGRVKSVMNYKKPTFWVIIAAVLVCIAAAVCFLTVPMGAHGVLYFYGEAYYQVSTREVGLPGGSRQVGHLDEKAVYETPEGVVLSVISGENLKKKWSGMPVYRYENSLYLTVVEGEGWLEFRPEGDIEVDPYWRYTGAERAAEYLKNADKLSAELEPFVMHGVTVTPVMEYVPSGKVMPDRPINFDRTEQILKLLHEFDVTSVNHLDMNTVREEYTVAGQSAVLYTDTGSCRISILYDKALGGSGEAANTALVFEFVDGSACAFYGGENGQNISDVSNAVNMAAEPRQYTFQGTGGNVTVTKRSTGERRAASPMISAWLESIFENTVLLAEPVDETGTFGWQVTLESGDVYLFDMEKVLIKTEDGTVYPIGGFEEGGFDDEDIRTFVGLGFSEDEDDVDAPAKAQRFFDMMPNEDWLLWYVDENGERTGRTVTSPREDYTHFLGNSLTGWEYTDESREGVPAVCLGSDEVYFSFVVEDTGSIITVYVDGKAQESFWEPPKSGLYTFGETVSIGYYRYEYWDAENYGVPAGGTIYEPDFADGFELYVEESYKVNASTMQATPYDLKKVTDEAVKSDIYNILKSITPVRQVTEAGTDLLHGTPSGPYGPSIFIEAGNYGYRITVKQREDFAGEIRQGGIYPAIFDEVSEDMVVVEFKRMGMFQNIKGVPVYELNGNDFLDVKSSDLNLKLDDFESVEAYAHELMEKVTYGWYSVMTKDDFEELSGIIDGLDADVSETIKNDIRVHKWPDHSGNEQETSHGAIPNAAMPGDTDWRVLSETKISEFEAVFELPGGSHSLAGMMLSSEYEHPEEIHIGMLFREGVHSPENGNYEWAGGVPVDEMEKLCPEEYEERYYADWYLTPAALMDELLYKYMGLTLEETEKVGLDWLTYLEEHDAYLGTATDTNMVIADITSGIELPDGTVRLSYHQRSMAGGVLYDAPDTHVMTLIPAPIGSGGMNGYYFYSNVPIE